MSPKEIDVFDLKQELNVLKIEVRNCEKWMDYAKDTIEKIQNKLDDLEDSRV
jgi:hypothetical protein